ncbi:MAG: sodium:solute symporter family protein [Phycisphaerales bacterium]
MRIFGTDPIQTWTFIFVGLSFSLYLFIAWVSRVRDTKGFYVAGQGVPAIANGMATGADWMSAASFISMAGLISTMGYAGGVYLMGWTGGYVLLALLLAPYLRKFGHFTVPDFIGDRYDSNTARLVAVVCAIFVSFTYVAGQMKGVGVVFSRFLEVPLEVGVLIGMLIVFIYATLGGMKGITWTQVAQYWVLITAFLVPAIAISIKLTGHPLPQVGMGSQVLADIDPVQPYLLDKLNQINHDFGFGSYTDTFVSEKWNKLNVFCVALALMAGTAGLPHVIIRFYTVRTVKAARWSAFWALTFIALLYLTAPATAAFARYYMLDTTAGLNGKTAEQLPDWYQSWSKSGLIAWFDFNGDGRVQMHNDPKINEIFKVDTVRDAEAAKAIKDDANAWVLANGGEAAREKLVALGGVHQPDKDIIVLATPEMAGLADWIIALIAAGGLAAALSTASGLLLVISSSVAHDLYYRVIDPKASEKKRLLVGRIVIGFAVVVAGYFGVNPPGFVGEVVAFAFGLAAASFFPIIVLGIFSKRVGTVPAITGMVLGIAFTAFYIFTQTAAKIVGPDLANAILGAAVYDDGTKNWLRTQWCFGINAQGIGTLGMLLNFVVTLALTPLFPPPSQATQDLVDSVREPEGAGPGLDIEAAPGH